MTQINELTRAVELSGGDLLPFWITGQGDTQSASLTDLAGFVEDQLATGAAEKDFATRAEAVAAIVELQNMEDGLTFRAAGLAYKRSFSATGIPDLQGFIPSGPISPGHWGALMDGTTNDQFQFQSCAQYCSVLGLQITVNGGEKIYINGTITTTNFLTLQGAGSLASVIVFGPLGHWVHNGGAVAYPNKQVSIRNIGFDTVGAFNPNILLNISFAGRDFVSGYNKTVVMDDVLFHTSGGNGFAMGCRLNNCTNLEISNTTMQNSIANLGNGWLIEGNEQPIDMYFRSSRVYFCDHCFDFNLGPSGQGGEGLFIMDSLFIFSNYGVSVNSETVHDVVQISGCNFNCYKRNILTVNIHNVHISDNTLYNASRTPQEATHTSIEILNTDPAFTFNMTGMIVNNRFFGATATVPTQTGISINGTNGANTQMLIDANSFYAVDYPIQLIAGSANVKVTDTNTYASFILAVNNLGTGNTISELVHTGANWFRRDNLGMLRKGGNSTYTITANKVTIDISTAALGGAFGTRIMHAQAVNQFPGSLPNEVISFDRAASTLSSLVFHCGTTAAGFIQLSWVADGV